MQVKTLLFAIAVASALSHATTFDVTSGQSIATVCGSAVAGDICQVHIGSYAGFTARSGSQGGGYVTYIAANTTQPTCNGNSGPSKVSCAGPSGDAVTITSGISLAGISYAAIVGFTMGSNTISVNTSSHNNVIAYNKWTGATGVINQTDSVGSTDSDNRIAYNVIDRTGITASTLAAIYFYGDRNLFEHNESINGSSDFIDGGGLNNVVRDNYFHGSNGSTSGEHIDFVQVQGSTGPTWSHGLTENNVEDGCTNQCHFFQIRGGAGFIPDTPIIRLNYAHNLDSLFGGFGDHSDNGGGASLINTWCYQNTAALETSNNAAGNGCGFDGFGAGTSLNNIFYNVQPGNSPNQTPIIQNTGQYLAANGDLTFTSGYSGAYNPPYSSEPTYAALHNVNPLFANYPTDGTLQPSSPALAAGVALTTTTNSGSSSTSLTVADGHGFQPRWGPINMPSGSSLNGNVQGDWIKIGSGVPSASNTTQITGISYGAGTAATFTISPALTWAINAPIYLYKDSDGTVQLTAALPNIGAQGAAQSLTFTPSALTFTPAQAVGTTSAGLTITVKNAGNTTVTGLNTGITIITGNFGDFNQSNNCPASLNSLATCTVTATFTPTASGTRTSSLQFTFAGGVGSPQSVTLTGTGTVVGPVLVCTPTSLSFSNQNINTTSPTQSISCQNTGGASLSVSSAGLTTGANFSIATSPAGCATGCTVLVNGSFTITASFTPLSAANLGDTINVASNAPTSVDHFAISGTGIDPTAVRLLQAVHCGPQVFTNSCTIAATTAGSFIAVGFAGYNSCGTGTTVTGVTDNAAAGSSTYTQVSGARSTNSSGATSFSDIWGASNVAAGITSLTLATSASCTGDAQIWEWANVQSVDVAAQLSSQTASATPSGAAVTTTSTKEAIVALLHPAPGSAPTGIHSGNVFTSDSLADGMGWAHYIPTVTGTYTPQWDMTSATFGASTAAFKQGSGTPVLSLSIGAVTFSGNQILQTAAPTLSIVAQNTGTAPLTITSISIGGASPGNYGIGSTCGGTLAVNATCIVTASFKPVDSATGTTTATVTFTTNDAASPAVVTLTGTAVLAPISFGGAVTRGK